MPATNVYLRHKQGPGINDIYEVSQATGEWTLQKTTWYWGVRLEYIHFQVNVEAQSSNNLTKNGDVLKVIELYLQICWGSQWRMHHLKLKQYFSMSFYRSYWKFLASLEGSTTNLHGNRQQTLGLYEQSTLRRTARSATLLCSRWFELRMEADDCDSDRCLFQS